MKLNDFEEKVHSLIVFNMLALSIFFFFINSKKIIWNLPLFCFLIIIFLLNKVKISKIFLVIILSIAFSFICSFFVFIFPNEQINNTQLISIFNFKFSNELLNSQLTVFYKIVLISSLSILGLSAINFEKMMISLMKKKWLKATLGYPLLLAYNSINMLLSENKKIHTNAKFRQIPFYKHWNTLFPLLVYAIRHADRGAMSLITRGINNQKAYYFNTKLHQKDYIILLIFLFVLANSVFHLLN